MLTSDPRADDEDCTISNGHVVVEKHPSRGAEFWKLLITLLL